MPTNLPETTEEFTRRVVDVVGSTLIPLCRKDKSGIRHLTGTAFVVNRLNRFYLVTAPHVYDTRPIVSGEPLSARLEYAVGPVNWMGLDNVVVASIHPEIKHGVSKIEADLIVLKLRKEFDPSRHLPWGKTHISYGALLPTRLPRDTAEYVYGGLPVSKNQPRGSDDAARRPHHYMFLGRSPPTDLYQSLGVNDETHLLLEFDRVGNVGTLPAGHIFPGPKGMSGGPIFLYRTETIKENNIGVVAVGIQTHKKEKFLIGVDIAAAIKGIEDLAIRTDL